VVISDVGKLAMLKLHLRCGNGIVPPLPVESGHGPYEFQQPATYSGFPVTLRIGPSGDEIESTATVEVRPEFEGILPKQSAEDLSESARLEVLKLFSPLHEANRRILRILGQELHLHDARWLTSKLGYSWSWDAVNWNVLPLQIEVTGIIIHPVYTLNGVWQEHVQRLLGSREEPLIAFEHLHGAMQMGDPRFRWIEATVAAELAIKEVLIRLEPRLESLLIEVPAPPIGKLYGPVLESIAGERSLYASELSKGAEKRNRLVHRPERMDLDLQDVADYLTIVDRAIWDLVKIYRKKLKLADHPRMTHVNIQQGLQSE
jgi:hypothetical protein